MSVIRVAKIRGYTVMSNYHLRDRELSCKACGLLSRMLSLPEEWDYTTQGLASICKEGVTAISAILRELEEHGYLVRVRKRNEKGQLAEMEYIIYETPRLNPSRSQQPDTPEEPAESCPDYLDEPPEEGSENESESPETEADLCVPPAREIHAQEVPSQDGRGQINKEIFNTQKTITDSLSVRSFSPSVNAREDEENAPMDEPVENSRERTDRSCMSGRTGRTEGRTECSPERAREHIRRQIDYALLCDRLNRVQLDELVEIMLEVAMNRSPTIRLSRDEEYPAAYVRERFRKITSEHVEKVFEGIRENAGRVKNVKAYLLAALFNAVSTIDHHYAMMAAADFGGSG